MDEVLEQHLEHGEELAKQLVEHLLDSGAAEIFIPLEIGGEEVEVIVRFKPKEGKPARLARLVT